MTSHSLSLEQVVDLLDLIHLIASQFFVRKSNRDDLFFELYLIDCVPVIIFCIREFFSRSLSFRQVLRALNHAVASCLLRALKMCFSFYGRVIVIWIVLSDLYLTFDVQSRYMCRWKCFSRKIDIRLRRRTAISSDLVLGLIQIPV